MFYKCAKDYRGTVGLGVVLWVEVSGKIGCDAVVFSCHEYSVRFAVVIRTAPLFPKWSSLSMLRMTVINKVVTDLSQSS